MRKYEEIEKELTKSLDLSLTKQREGRGGIILTYLEGHTIINQLNRIFGYDGWSYEIVELTQTTKYTTEKEGKTYANIGYLARVRLKVYFPDRAIEREDVGYGSGVAINPNDAYESAVKEAVTDALKRASRTLGNQFGNSLYGRGDIGEKGAKEMEAKEISPKQIRFIHTLAEDKGVDIEDLEAWLIENYDKGIEELTRAEASEVINTLKSSPEQIRGFSGGISYNEENDLPIEEDDEVPFK